MYMNLETMSHDQAVSSHAPERYVLGELDPAERDAFEGHYFDCTTCFDQVKKGSQFLSYAGEVLGPEQEKGWFAVLLGDLRRPAPAFVTAALVCAMGLGTYQQIQIADARRPRVEASFFVPSDVKGAPKVISVSRKSQLSLSADFTPKSEFTSYRAKIVAESGKVEYTLPLAAGQTGYSITIGLPASALRPGKHSLVIEGQKSDGSMTELHHGSFDLQFVD
jgi:hypothetical protein